MKKNVLTPVAPLLAKPDFSSEVVSQSLYGWPVEVLEEKSHFVRVQSEDGYQGWMSRRHLSDESLPVGPRLKMKFSAVPIYATPHVNRSAPLITLPFEVELPVLVEPIEEENRWIQVGLLKGQKGWVQRADVWMPTPRWDREEVLQLSQQFVGLPYIWGGRSSFGYDCSGFVQMLFRLSGYSLPRDARQQIEAPECQSVSWEKKERGDLLFFGSSSNSITHVGVYLGKNELINASVRPIPRLQVALVAFYENYFPFYTARRI